MQAPETTRKLDIDGDGEMDCLALTEGQAGVYSGPCISGGTGNWIWRSPEDWRVAQAEVSDLNRDGELEITLLVWRDFSYWPVDSYMLHGKRIEGFHDADNQSCQLILVGNIHGEVRELWAGSALVDPVMQFAAVDLEGDGHQELVALEGHYDDPVNTPAWALSVWAWNGFGFSKQDRQEGTFSGIKIMRIDNDEIILLSQIEK